MIITSNKEPSLEEFNYLCKRTEEIMNAKALKEPEYFIGKGAQKLEPEVKLAMDEAAKNTPFENTIKIISGQKFPDIVAAKYYGLEVKSTKENQWTIIGGSVAEGTRVEDVEYINLIFGKLHKPVEFRVKRYQDCLSDIAVTHSPRYKIDMNLGENDTIFSKMGIEYDELRKLDNPMTPVVEYFRSTLKEGESLWWVNGSETVNETVPAKIRLWSSLGHDEKQELLTKGLALFPEIFGNSARKYEQFTLWLVAKYGIVSTSMRDTFTAGGRRDLVLNGKVYPSVPRIYERLSNHDADVFNTIQSTEKEVLIETWKVNKVAYKNRISQWIELVNEHSKTQGLDVKEMLEDMFCNLG